MLSNSLTENSPVAVYVSSHLWLVMNHRRSWQKALINLKPLVWAFFLFFIPTYYCSLFKVYFKENPSLWQVTKKVCLILWMCVLISAKPFYLGIFHQCNCLLSVPQQSCQCQDPATFKWTFIKWKRARHWSVTLGLRSHICITDFGSEPGARSSPAAQWWFLSAIMQVEQGWFRAVSEMWRGYSSTRNSCFYYLMMVRS